MPNIVPSLCCLLAEPNKNQKYRTLTLSRAKRLTSLELEKLLSEIWEHNIRAACELVHYCQSNNWNYRLPSSIFPLYTHSIAQKLSLPDTEPLRKQIESSPIRISMHPDQFNVLASATPKVVDATIRELDFHGEILDRLQQPNNHWAPINVHMNCFRGYPLETIAQRFFSAFSRLSQSVRNRLTLENEDKQNSWNVDLLISFFPDIPITYDSLHHRCNDGGIHPSDAMRRAVYTWPGKIIPLFHYSTSVSGGKNPRAHSNCPEGDFPIEFYLFGGDLHLDFEFKFKELAISYWKNTYFNLTSTSFSS